MFKKIKSIIKNKAESRNYKKAKLENLKCNICKNGVYKNSMELNRAGTKYYFLCDNCKAAYTVKVEDVNIDNKDSKEV